MGIFDWDPQLRSMLIPACLLILVVLPMQMHPGE